MKLKKCKACGINISPNAEACPVCGEPSTAKKIQNVSRGLIALGCFIPLLIFCFTCAYMLSSDTKPAPNFNAPLSIPQIKHDAVSPEPQITINKSVQFTPAPGKWRIVKTWQGKGIKNTEQFDVSRQWRILWKSWKTDDSGGIIQIFVYKEAGSLVGMAANQQDAGQDTSYFHEAGNFYLTVNSANLNWWVQVEEFN